MTERHTECPLFLSQSLQPGLAEKLHEAVAEEEEREVAVERPLKVADEPLWVKESPAEQPVEVVVDEEEREVVLEPLEWPVDAEGEEQPEGVVQPRLKETMEQLPIEGLSADVLPEVVTKEPTRGIDLEGPLRAAQTMGRFATSAVLKNLPRLAAGGAFLVLVCVGGLIALGVLRGALETGRASSGALASLVPGALLLVSVISLLGAVLLIGLFLWTRRGTSR